MKRKHENITITSVTDHPHNAEKLLIVTDWGLEFDAWRSATKNADAWAGETGTLFYEDREFNGVTYSNLKGFKPNTEKTPERPRRPSAVENDTDYATARAQVEDELARYGCTASKFVPWGEYATWEQRVEARIQSRVRTLEMNRTLSRLGKRPVVPGNDPDIQNNLNELKVDPETVADTFSMIRRTVQKVAP